MNNKKRKFQMPTAYTVLLIIIFILAGVSHLINDPSIVKATFSNIIMSPIKGFTNAIEVSLFVLILGGFLGVINKTGVLYTSISSVVKKLKGKELFLIPILMTLFSIGGTTFGMSEETVAFYALIIATMMAAGFDSIVGTSVILLGAGAGVLGSTINPFAISVAVDMANEAGVSVNQGTIIALGAVLWISTTAICIWYVMSYAKKVHNKPENSILSKEEQKESQKAFETRSSDKDTSLSGRGKIVLFLFALSFVVMIISLIPWNKFGVTIFDSSTSWLTGSSFGNWYFSELSAWFLIVAILSGIVYGIKERDLVDAFIAGSADMIGVALVIGVSRGISVIMEETNLSNYLLTHASNALNGMSAFLFTIFAYIIYLGLSFLIPSTSGLATGSIGIFAPLAKSLGLSPEVMILIFSAACGLVNLVTPTSGVVMGGLAIAKIEFTSWIKFVLKLLLIILVANLIILSIAMAIIR